GDDHRLQRFGLALGLALVGLVLAVRGLVRRLLGLGQACNSDDTCRETDAHSQRQTFHSVDHWELPSKYGTTKRVHWGVPGHRYKALQMCRAPILCCITAI